MRPCQSLHDHCQADQVNPGTELEECPIFKEPRWFHVHEFRELVSTTSLKTVCSIKAVTLLNDRHTIPLLNESYFIMCCAMRLEFWKLCQSNIGMALSQPNTISIKERVMERSVLALTDTNGAEYRFGSIGSILCEWSHNLVKNSRLMSF